MPIILRNCSPSSKMGREDTLHGYHYRMARSPTRFNLCWVNLLYNLIYAIMTKTMRSPSHGWRGWQLPPTQAALPALPLCLSHSHETAKCRGDILKWSMLVV